MRTFNDIYSTIAKQIQKISGNQTNFRTSDVVSGSVISNPSSNNDLTSILESINNITNNLTAISQAIQNTSASIVSGGNITPDNPPTGYINISASKFLLNGNIITIDSKRVNCFAGIPTDRPLTLYLSIDNNQKFYLDNFIPNTTSRVLLGKIVYPSINTARIVQHMSDSTNGYDGYIIQRKDLFFDEDFVIDDESLADLRGIMDQLLAGNLVGSLSLSEGLTIKNTTGSLLMDSNSVQIINPINNKLLAKFNDTGIYFYDKNGTEISRFTNIDSKIGGWLISNGVIGSTNGSISLNGNLNTITVKDIYGNLLVELGLNSVIAGWIINNSSITSPNSKIVLDSANDQILIKDGSGNILVQLSTTSLLAGWSISKNAITSPNGKIIFDSDNQQIRIYDSGNNLVVNLGTSSTLSGWTLNGSCITSNNGNIILDPIQSKISIHGLAGTGYLTNIYSSGITVTCKQFQVSHPPMNQGDYIHNVIVKDGSSNVVNGTSYFYGAVTGEFVITSAASLMPIFNNGACIYVDYKLNQSNVDTTYSDKLKITFQERASAFFSDDSLVDGQNVTNLMIGNAQIQNGVINAQKISVDDLSAISANMGTITAGIIENGATDVYLDLYNGKLNLHSRDSNLKNVIAIGDTSSSQYLKYNTDTNTLTVRNTDQIRNVADFGNSIALAIADLGTTGGRIYLPTGQYSINSQITLPYNLIIEGNGSCIITTINNAMITRTSSDSVIVFKDCAIYNNGISSNSFIYLQGSQSGVFNMLTLNNCTIIGNSNYFINQDSTMKNIVFNSCVVKNFNCINNYNTSSGGLLQCFFSNCQFFSCTVLRSVMNYHAGSSKISNCIFNYSNIYLQNQMIIDHCYFDTGSPGSTFVCINSNSDISNAVISNNIVNLTLPFYTGFSYLNNVHDYFIDTNINSNTLYYVSIFNNLTYGGIRIFNLYNVFECNIFNNILESYLPETGGAGLYVNNSMAYTTVSGNTFNAYGTIAMGYFYGYSIYFKKDTGYLSNECNIICNNKMLDSKVNGISIGVNNWVFVIPGTIDPYGPKSCYYSNTFGNGLPEFTYDNMYIGLYNNVNIPARHTFTNSGAPFLVNSVTKVNNLNADMVDGYCVSHNSNGIPLSDGTLNTNLNADKLDGYHSSHSSGNIPISDGTVNTNLNADLINGFRIQKGTTSTDANGDLTITFSPSFNSAPVVMVCVGQADCAHRANVDNSGVSSSSAHIVTYLSNGTKAGPIYVNWIAIGY